ncbi:MAG TPA: lasso RiPP family leader peptide-containing protein [Gemmatimonadota bacterium]|nr:lasso RiPP family leader peptide-containing protein [Gemmatimonadota bacterium]
MDKRPYETPRLQTLGTVQELTQDLDFNGSAGSVDLCVPFRKTGDDALSFIDPCEPETT